MSHVENQQRKSRPSIPPYIEKALFVAAAGRCQFPGCNKFLFEHPTTFQPANFSNKAHIEALGERGPRANPSTSLEELNDISNLMLLCLDCHKLIDTRVDDYPVAQLKNFKAEHEQRMRYLTGLDPTLRSFVILCEANIEDRVVKIPHGHILEAISPKFPASREGISIQLNRTPGQSSPGFFSVKAQEISQMVDKVFYPIAGASNVEHVSVFALGPIPLLIHLGAKIGDSTPSDIYQLHRDACDWQWKSAASTPMFSIRCLKQGTDDEVVTLIHLSGTNNVEHLPPELQKATVYELLVTSEEPNLFLLKTRACLTAFQSAFRSLLTEVRRNHPGQNRLHIMPAIPASAAVMLGKTRLPKIDPKFEIYDFDRSSNKFVHALGV